MYRGCLATVLKQSLQNGVSFLVFQEVQQFLRHFLNSSHLDCKSSTSLILIDLIAGASAGICAVLTNNPIDVVKT